MFNQQSICTEAGKPADPFNVNCVGRMCAQIDGIDEIALGFTVNGKLSVTIVTDVTSLSLAMKTWSSGAGGRMNSSLITASGVPLWIELVLVLP